MLVRPWPKRSLVDHLFHRVCGLMSEPCEIEWQVPNLSIRDGTGRTVVDIAVETDRAWLKRELLGSQLALFSNTIVMKMKRAQRHKLCTYDLCAHAATVIPARMTAASPRLPVQARVLRERVCDAAPLRLQDLRHSLHRRRRLLRSVR
jgi:hypothetical protein